MEQAYAPGALESEVQQSIHSHIEHVLGQFDLSSEDGTNAALAKALQQVRKAQTLWQHRRLSLAVKALAPLACKAYGKQR